MERRRLLSLIGAVIVLGVAGAGWFFSGVSDASLPTLPIPGEGVNTFRVEVLNGTEETGLARDVTRSLRRQGIDVVYYGSVRDSVWLGTQILIRRGDSVAAVAVRDALGVGTVIEEPEPKLLLDVSVILGMDAVQRFRLDP